jgi:iron complex outermembrane receptor protein
VKGTVYDAETKEALPFVSIQIKNTTIGTTTDAKGYFEINQLCERDYDLMFFFLGYKTLSHHHDFHHSTITIFLAPEAVLLESVVIEESASREGLSSSTASQISKETLDRVASESLGDVASQIAGVNTISTGQNVVKPVIHGLHSNRILIVNEGLRHEFQNWGTDHAPEIDPSLVDNLEVIKGAATVRYGPDALGGVIKISAPKLELSTPLKGSLSLTGKSNGQAGEGTVQLQKGFRWWSVLASGSYNKQGDLHAPDYQLTNTGKEEYSYSAGLRIHPLAQLDIEFFYSHFDQVLGILRGSVNTNLDDLLLALNAEVPNFTEAFSYDINTPKQTVVHDLYKARLHWIGDHQSFELQYGYQRNQRQEFDVRRGTDLEVPNIDLELTTHSLDGEWIHPSIGRLNGRFGFQFARQANDNIPGTNTVPFVPNYDQDRLGAYWIESFRLNDQSSLEAGVRYDEQHTEVVGRKSNNNIYRNDFSYQNFTATIGYQTKLSEASKFRTNLGTAWRPPNVAELYRFGRHLSFLEYGLWRYTINLERDLISTQNILTEEERPAPSEVGYKWINTYEYRGEKTNLELTGYVNYIENFINTRPGGLTSTVRGVSPFFIYDQTNALLWGADLSVEHTHNDRWHSAFKSSYLWAKAVEQEDYFIGLPPANVQYELGFKPKIKGIEKTAFRLAGQYTFEQFQYPRTLTVEEVINAFRLDLDLFANDASNFDIAPPPPAFFLLDFSSEIKVKKLAIRFQVRNVLNTSFRRYTDRLRYYTDDLGRNFIVTLGYQIR